eukprot:gene2475-2816_t
MRFIAILLVAIIALSYNGINASDLGCEVCDFVVKHAEDFVQQNRTVTQIEADLDLACRVLPSTLSYNCKVIVKSYTPLIVNMILNKEDPDTICKQINLCTAAVESNEIECMMCDYVVKKVAGYVSSNATEVQVLTYLDNDCKFLKTSKWVSACQTVVNEYEPMIFDYISSGALPDTICAKIGLCASFEAFDASTLTCPVCTYLVSRVETYVAANSTEAEMIALLDKVCKDLGSKYSGICDSMVSVYLPEIVIYIENGHTAPEICTELQLCPPAVEEAIHTVEVRVVQEIAQIAADISCELCEIVLNEIIRMGNSTEVEIFTTLKNDCTYFRESTFVKECSNFVQTYGEDLITYISTHENPSGACTSMKLCPTN